MNYSVDFRAALGQAMTDHDRFGHISDSEMTEEGSLRVVGINRSDTVQMSNMAVDEFGPDLMQGGAAMSAAILGIIEIAMATGVRLERARWEDQGLMATGYEVSFYRDIERIRGALESIAGNLDTVAEAKAAGMVDSATITELREERDWFGGALLRIETEAPSGDWRHLQRVAHEALEHFQKEET